MKEIRWRILSPEEIKEHENNICGVKRGGPRSNTYCELPKDHTTGEEHDPWHWNFHTGRSRTGKWFSWK